MKKLLLSLLAISALTFSCKKDEVVVNPDKIYQVSTSLSGANELPMVTSSATGSTTGTYNQTTKMLTVSTTLNGITFSAETTMNLGDRLQVGSYQIIPCLTSDLECDWEIDSPDSIATQEIANQTEMCNVTVQPEFVYDLGLDEYDRNQSEPFGTDFDFAQIDRNNPAVTAEIEMLRLEVEQLRFELAERDAQQFMAKEPRPSLDDDNESYETIRLVNRLEELLSELQTSDERVRGMEDMLRAADQATQAEQEERRQLESWVTEIEQRVSQREAESTAELSRTQAKLCDLQGHYQQAQIHFKQAWEAKNSAQPNAAIELIQTLREQVQTLQQQQAKLSDEHEQLQAQSVQGEQRSPGEFQQLEQSFLELQVATSRERADLARQREQLERLKNELEQKLSSGEADDANSKIRAMRQHLTAIHEQELQDRKKRSLSGRISSLLSRSGR